MKGTLHNENGYIARAFKFYNEMINGIFMIYTALGAVACLIRIWKQRQKVDEYFG